MIRVYIAGAITPTGDGNHAIEFLENVRKGVRAAIYLIHEGFAPFCPMLDLQYFLSLPYGWNIEVDKIYQLSIEWMKACDAIFLLSGAEESKGWRKEKEIADQEGIPIYTSIGSLKDNVEKGVIKCQH
jgi:hypothetical protein